MVYHVFSMGLGGVEGYGVTVECCITQGVEKAMNLYNRRHSQ